jgi:pentatricopeptide repeat protein
MSMSTILDVISATSAVDMLSTVWVELTMASLAALVWFTVTGTVYMPKGSRKFERVSPPRSPRGEPSAAQIQLATKALRQGRLSDGISLLKDLPETCTGCIPATAAPRLLMAVAKAANFEEALAHASVLSGKVEPRALEAAVLEASKNKDMAACRQLQALSMPMMISKSPRTLEALARVHAADVAMLRNLVDETEAPLAKCFAGAVLQACAALREVDLAMEVFEKVSESDAAALREVTEKASESSGKSGGEKPCRAGHSRDALAKEIQACGKSGNLKAALEAFDASSQSRSTFVYNAILEACIECGNLEKASHYFSQAGSKGFVDVVSYNIMMKGYLAQGDEKAATALLREISETGLSPSHNSYHGLLNYRASALDRTGAWQLVDEMQAAGVSPNSVTFSILLKSKATSANDVSKILSLVESTEHKMDEMFFGTVVEACIRTSSLDLLSKQTAMFAGQGGSAALTAPTYGSLIKAYGQMWDVKRVSELWSEMTSNNVQPTAITLGCMVEALVINYRTADAWKLAQKMLSEENTRPLVNTVIYSTIIKGFSHMKELAKVMELYEEMRAHGVQANTITYNTILNAFAQSGAMDRVPALLEHMKTATPPVEPDLVTYSTLVKGFCNSGSLDRAIDTMKEMQVSSKYQPDEVMYNSLLDGCAKEHRPDDALKLFGEMKKAGVAPSNFTLSMLVKLMGRCKRLNQAFTLIEEITEEYGLKVNIQVYTCLISACFNNRQAFKALAVHDKIIKEGLFADEMTYNSLVQGCLKAGLADKAVQLAKYSHGIGLPKGKWAPAGISERCLSELVSALGGAGSQEAKALKAELAACQLAPQKGK